MTELNDLFQVVLSPVRILWVKKASNIIFDKDSHLPPPIYTLYLNNKNGCLSLRIRS